jgi:hypothetical protein
MDQNTKTTLTILGGVAAGAAVIAGIIVAVNSSKSSGGGGQNTKYQVGDILYNPPDTADTFTITGFQEINGVLYYNFVQNQDQTTFVEPVSLVDNSTAWALSSSGGGGVGGGGGGTQSNPLVFSSFAAMNSTNCPKGEFYASVNGTVFLADNVSNQVYALMRNTVGTMQVAWIPIGSVNVYIIPTGTWQLATS